MQMLHRLTCGCQCGYILPISWTAAEISGHKNHYKRLMPWSRGLSSKGSNRSKSTRYSPRIINLIAFQIFHDTRHTTPGQHRHLKMLSCNPACTEPVADHSATRNIRASHPAGHPLYVQCGGAASKQVSMCAYDPLGGPQQMCQMVPCILYQTVILNNKLYVRRLFMTYMPTYADDSEPKPYNY